MESIKSLADHKGWYGIPKDFRLSLRLAEFETPREFFKHVGELLKGRDFEITEEMDMFLNWMGCAIGNDRLDLLGRTGVVKGQFVRCETELVAERFEPLDGGLFDVRLEEAHSISS